MLAIRSPEKRGDVESLMAVFQRLSWNGMATTTTIRKRRRRKRKKWGDRYHWLQIMLTVSFCAPCLVILPTLLALVFFVQLRFPEFTSIKGGNAQLEL